MKPFRKYVRLETEVVEVRHHGDDHLKFSFAFYPELRQDPETTHYLARFAAFKDQIGHGKNPEEAIRSLTGAFHTYIQAVLESGGLEALESWLEGHGFELIRDEEVLNGWSKSPEPVSIQVATS